MTRSSQTSILVDTRSEQLSSNVADIASALTTPVAHEYFLVEEVENNGVDSTLGSVGGASPIQQAYQRPLNQVTYKTVEDVVTDPDPSGTFTLAAGVYVVEAGSVMRHVADTGGTVPSQIFLEVGSLPLIEGFAHDHAGGDQYLCKLRGQFRITETSDVKLHHWFEADVGSYHFGFAASAANGTGDSVTLSSPDERYAYVHLIKIANTTAASTANTIVEQRYADFNKCRPFATKAVGPLLPPLIIEQGNRRTFEARLVGQARGSVAGQDQSFDWLGVDASISPTSLADRQSPFTLNVDSINRVGTFGPRLGLVRMQQKGASQDTGVSISDLQIYSEGNVRAYMLLAGDDSGGSLLEEAAYQTVVVPPALKPAFAPTVTLTSSSNEIDIAISAIDHLSGIESILVRWNQSGYPTSTFDDSERNSAAADKEEFNWEGDDAFSDSTSQSFTATDVYFVAVWLKTGLGWSLPYRAKVTIA